jgi:hypothetical protein
MPPGNYSVRFTAAGFKTSEEPSVTVNVTETPVLNRRLEVGAQSAQVTVEATAETIQTQNATNGVSWVHRKSRICRLAFRNYTRVVDLSPGVVTNAANAAAVWNGTQDVSANGAKANQSGRWGWALRCLTAVVPRLSLRTEITPGDTIGIGAIS